MRKSVFLLACIALTACDAKTERQSVDLSKLTYQQDARTGECFAVVGHTEGGNFIGNTKGFTITWVPCTPKVLEAVKDDLRGW